MQIEVSHEKNVHIACGLIRKRFHNITRRFICVNDKGILNIHVVRKYFICFIEFLKIFCNCQ